MTRVAIFPARGGSKRVPRKNIRDFCGKPMLQWPLETAVSSGVFDEIIVSTDDDEIAALAEKLGAQVPFKRPEQLANDYAGTVDVICDAVERLTEGFGDQELTVCCIYPTTPFLYPEDLCDSYQCLYANSCDYVVPVTTYPHPIERSLRLRPKAHLEPRYPELMPKRTQDLEIAYHDAGLFYWGKAEAWLSRKPLISTRSIGYPVPRWRAADIDTQEDWDQAELLAKGIFSKEI